MSNRIETAITAVLECGSFCWRMVKPIVVRILMVGYLVAGSGMMLMQPVVEFPFLWVKVWWADYFRELREMGREWWAGFVDPMD